MIIAFHGTEVIQIAESKILDSSFHQIFLEMKLVLVDYIHLIQWK